MSDKRIRFTWGGAGKFHVFLCIEGVSISRIYELVIPDVGGPRTAQEIVERGNAALEKWIPEFLHGDAILPAREAKNP